MKKSMILIVIFSFFSLASCVNTNTEEIMTINGDVTSEIDVGSNYTELGLLIPEKYVYVIEGSVDTSVVGSYIITYTILTKNGELVKKLYRYVDVVDKENPVLSLFDDIVLYIGFPYDIHDLIDDYSDNYDSKDELTLEYDSTIFSKTTPGLYALEITVKDSSGNKTTINSSVQYILDFFKLIEHVYEYQTYLISKGTTGIGSSYIKVQINSSTSFTYYDSGSIHYLKSFTTALGTRATIQISGDYGQMNEANISYHVTGIGTYSVGFINFDATTDYDTLTFTKFGSMINNLNLKEQDMINEFNPRALPTLEEFKYYFENTLNLKFT